MTFTLRPGPVDVHAHWLPRELFGLPPGAPFGAITDRDGELHVGETPLSIQTRLMSDVDAIRVDMDRAGIGARVLSAPPFAFARDDLDGATDYVASFNDALARVVRDGGGAFGGFGSVTLADPDVARREIEVLAASEGIYGIAIPPVLADSSLDSEPLVSVLAAAAENDLAVLVHPMQLPSPTLAAHYLVNLLGNPVETATAIASLLLGGIAERLPDLRICFVHGGGCAPDLLGRWDHAWRARADVSRSSSTPPSEGFTRIFLDTVTHDEDAFRLLAQKAGEHRIVLGSDYPFDMADGDPVAHALSWGADEAALARAARELLGL
ncbi:2-hydroxy-3-carboxy-6-oxo-7-methylocta-2,4-dienoate decarboxylase [Cnuibacter physcomitrellae]|uniref:2-hydroxy-3-carboxy-6-oxo-7-methylocta-2, 4-dienoate decarboxylase n=1 Tax=Cnuibacter physcomitrellae TaxID=1619308 RepID=A0A1X9LQ55_9MICO|nr:amidohydrolase family protein [Cnuibacter physcomitrellae]ARJ05259.1 2-hydroxy-3-carboxy-6-oxo-7-methylocta-2,4-dienoate decarboxylase [Cnuibacter physcomitrellae]GGI35309.1 2-hydroxy-3-carboxy-6-oxo-7-methylocta-2,4-dienoate decarboxylase [Cnuibacter physcomitrellae]